MEYLKNIFDKSIIANDKNINWHSIFDNPQLVFGAPLFDIFKDFNKYSLTMEKEIENFPIESKKADLRAGYNSYKKYTSGCMVRFWTDADYFFIKAEVSRMYDYQKMPIFNSSGFDIYFYNRQTKEYTHGTVVAPNVREKIFIEKVFIPKGEFDIVIYLPTYNDVINLYIGLDKGKTLSTAIEFRNIEPICFYGHSITQGASASRSGNVCCNIVAREVGAEIYNFSMSNCCVGFQSVAETIGKLNISAFVFDYSRNAPNLQHFKNSYEPFYNKVRKHHKNIPIIFVTTSDFLGNKFYDDMDKIIYDVFESAKSRNENVYLVDIKSLYDIEDNENFDLIAEDGGHYNEYGMLKLADAISNIIVKHYLLKN